MNDAAAEADVVIIKDDRLARCDGPLGDIEGDIGLTILDALDCTGLVRLSIADFGETLERQVRGGGCDPGQFIGNQVVGEECRMQCALFHVNDILSYVFADNEPGVAWAPDAHPLALSDRVVGGALMFTDDLSR